jgi:hypothetical protein
LSSVAVNAICCRAGDGGPRFFTKRKSRPASTECTGPRHGPTVSLQLALWLERESETYRLWTRQAARAESDVQGHPLADSSNCASGLRTG